MSVLHATDGTLWMATLAGVDRYNGISVLEYRTNKPQKEHLPSSSILKILESKFGEIYVATADSGLLCFSEKENRFERIDSGRKLDFPTSRMSAAFSSSTGDIWMGYETGDVIRYSPLTRTIEKVEFNFGQTIVSFSESKDGKVLTASDNGSIFSISRDMKDIRQISINNSCKKKFAAIDEIAMAYSDRLWLGTIGNGPLLLDMALGTCESPESDESKSSQIGRADVHRILFDSISGSTLIASDQGLYEIDSKRNIFLISTNNSNISDNEVVSIARGKGDIYWIGTYSGLSYMVPTVFETNAKFSNSKLHSIVAIDSYGGSGTWIASYDGLLFREGASTDHHELSRILPGSTLTNRKVMSMEVDSRGLWVGYRATGLQFFDFADSRSVHSWNSEGVASISSNSISAILSLRDGKVLVGTYDAGVNIVSLDAGTEHFSVGDNRVIFLHETRQGTVLVGTGSGFYEFDAETGSTLELRLFESDYSSQTKPLIWDIVESPSGDIWLATMHHGLFHSKRASSEIISERTFLSVSGSAELFSTLYAIEVDNDGYVWCSTNSGLVRVHPESLQMQIFSKRHGIEISEFDFGVSHKDEGGYLYFGGTEGYVKFDPKDIDPVQEIPPLSFISIEVSDSIFQSVSNLQKTSKIQLTHKDQFIQFEFSVLDFIDPEKNQYRYMLEGFDHDWIDNGTRNSAKYTSLPAGEYTMRVQGANSAGVWNRDGISIDVQVLPAPWLTWWAFTLYALAAFLLLWLFLRTYISFAVQRMFKQKTLEMDEAEERADDEMQEQLDIHDDLVKSVYRHSISTLNLIGELLSTKGAHLDDDNACEILQASVSRVDALALLEECLYYQNEVLLADLNKYTNILFSRLLKNAVVGGEHITTINEVSSQPFPIEQASPLAIVLFELIENAIQHAFEDPSAANYLHVVLAPDQSGDSDANFRLVVRDNGPGIPPNIDPISALTSGLAIVSSMGRKLSATVHVTSENGTMVSITFPRLVEQ